MPFDVTPASALTATAPAVGIFWRVGDALVIDRSTLGDAEPYGDCITHATGHYERWQEWRTLGSSRLVAKGYPAAIGRPSTTNGRAAGSSTRFRRAASSIYADRRLQSREIVDALKKAFGLGDAEIVVKSDLHYR